MSENTKKWIQTQRFDPPPLTFFLAFETKWMQIRVSANELNSPERIRYARSKVNCDLPRDYSNLNHMPQNDSTFLKTFFEE